jgi:hypothetical protein
MVTDFPTCSAGPLAVLVQSYNDLFAGPDGYLSPEGIVIALDLGWQTVLQKSGVSLLAVISARAQLGSAVRGSTVCTGFEESDYRSHPAVIVGGVGKVQLAQDASHVLLDGAFGEIQPTGDADVGPPLCHQRQYFVLATTEDSKGVFASACGDQILDERRIDHRGTFDDPMQ